MRRRVISYGYIVAEHFQRAAAYVDPILKGKKPADDGAQRGAGSSPNLYRATVDVPARFRKSKSVGAVF